ncbi:MAG: hypothetical protein KME54_04810 [Tolypothrix brevis GSE-NOS-MK-07-07A]|nr:hypothetical protein [Tolypothrix brevis GSE-NOS-MK-07-07A]
MTNSLVEVLYQVLLFIRGSTAMVCACFAKVGYYCWLKTRFAVLICLNVIRCEEGIREGCRVKLQFVPVYTFSDFASTKRHIILFTLLSKVLTENFARRRKSKHNVMWLQIFKRRYISRESN